MAQDIEPDSRLTVVAFDMGVTTGWAWNSLDQKTLLESDLSLSRKLRSGSRDCGEITGEGGLHRRGLSPSSPFVGWDNAIVDRACEKVRSVWVEAEVEPDKDVFLVVLEDFILQTRDSARHTLSPVRLNAAFQWEFRNSGIQIVTQQPSEAMRTVTDARLKGWGLYDETARFGKNEHARDATRHCTLGIRRWMGDARFRGGLVNGLIPTQKSKAF
jgi:hypothetical protein